MTKLGPDEREGFRDVGHRIRVTITGAEKDNALTPVLNQP